MATEALGQKLRQLREARGEPLWTVAAAAEMDSTLLSKIELGQRLPTEEQTKALAKYFGVAARDLEAERITAKFWRDHAENPAAGRAVLMIRETAAAYAVDKPVNKKKRG